MHHSTRRDFLKLTGETGVGLVAFSALLGAQDKYDVLIQGQFANKLRLLQQVGGQYMQDNFTLGPAPTDWLLQLARYVGRGGGQRIDAHGYWIFKGNGERKCWQAVNGRGALRYWNEDGRAGGNPEDWEMFTFEQVSKPNQTVKIRNTRYRAYVGLVANTFSCNESVANAAIFKVEFP